MFDSSSVKAAELLSYFGKNTAVTVLHNYGTDVLEVRSARTNLTIASVAVSSEPMALAVFAFETMNNKRFPKNRKMNKAWSPIRFSAASKAMMEADSGISFS